jgi:tetratricopeptide (TPR) repeat protein
MLPVGLEPASDDPVEPIERASMPATIAHFTIVRELGRGGMGIVYEAHDPDLERHVAIKVVRDRRAGSAAGIRLIAEAKAMARLAHPNVVGVHEVGTIDNQVYVVMELVPGETLAGWLGRELRPWREIVAMFVQAGEGLLAAHRAGLIHRDFKPSNVLVDHGGRARVSDFGLARSEERSTTKPALAVGSENSGIAGTPAYMAPEQHSGMPIDARVDQFAFAVSLDWTLGRAVGKPARRVRAALSRARSLDREERFPDLDDLLAELRASLTSQRRRLAIAGGGIALVGAVALLATTPASSSSCDDGTQLVEQVWNPYVRVAQYGKFLRTRPGASVASSSTADIVDDWVDRWKLGRKAACTVDNPQRESRIGCLDGHLQELRAQVALWGDADASIVDRAVRAATMLPQPQACAGSSAGPLEPALRDKIATLDALLRSGRAKQAHDGIADMLALAEGAQPPNPRALATALITAGRVAREMGNAETARGYLARAAHEAGRATDDALMLDALLDQASVIVDLGRPRDALGLLDAADALQARGQVDVAERVALHRADALGQAGRAKESIAETMRVLPGLEARALRDPTARPQLSTALGQLAAAQLQIDREAARRTLLRALAIDEAQYGTEHPEVAKTLHDLGAAEVQLERNDEALAHLNRASRIFIRSYGERHPMVGANYMTLANLALHQGRLDEAKRIYVSARDALTGVLPEDAPHFIAIEEGLGDIARGADNCKEALPHYTRAVKLLAQSGHGENEHAMQLTNLGYCLQDTGRLAEARKTLEHSLAEIDRLQMPRRWKSEPLAILAEMEFAAGRVAKAIELEKAAIAALDGETGSDVAAMRDYQQQQLKAWTKR